MRAPTPDGRRAVERVLDAAHGLPIGERGAPRRRVRRGAPTVYLEIGPGLAPLRSGPRFRRALERVRLD